MLGFRLQEAALPDYMYLTDLSTRSGIERPTESLLGAKSRDLVASRPRGKESVDQPDGTHLSLRLQICATTRSQGDKPEQSDRYEK